MAQADSSVGDFEIEGDTDDDSGAGDPVDWDSVATGTPPVIVSPPNGFTDVFGNGKEDGFGGNSHNNSPATWACGNVSTPAKDDIKGGKVGFRTIDGQQYVYVNFTREGTTGSVDIDWEFNQGSAPHPSASCVGVLPARTNGDLVIAFDQQGNDLPELTLHRWVGDATTGSLVPVAEHALVFRGAVSGNRTFGEAALNLSAALGRTVRCGEFSTVYMKSRASTSINSDLKDRTRTSPAALGECPASSIDKSVRNVTTNGQFGPTATASPGDQLEYRIVYTNAGAAPATNVTVTDTIEAHQTFVSCDSDCEGPTQGVLTWHLGEVSNVAPNNTRTVTFRVNLDHTFAAGQTTVSNTATVDTTEETPKSDTTTTTVTASAAITQQKSANRTTANVGDQVTYSITYTNTGSAAGSVSPSDNYDQAHFDVDDSTISDGGIDTGSVINWSNIVVPPKIGNVNGTKTVSYTGVVIGTFSGGAGTCQPGQFPVINTVTITGESDSHTLCVNAAPLLSQTKTASKNPANVGDTITYTITYTNTGSAAGTVSPSDNYDEAHFDVDPTTVSDGGVDDGSVINWSNIVVPAKTNGVNGTKSVSYTGVVIGSFTSPAGPGCGTGQFPVLNTVQITGEVDTYTLCVNAAPAITQAKTASVPTASVGDEVTYTITYTNTGNASGTVDPSDNYDEVHFDPDEATISDGGVDNGSAINWDDIVVPPKHNGVNGTKSVTYTGTVIGTFPSTPAPGCPPGQHPVINSVTITGETDSHTLCVEAEAEITQDKIASVETARIGDDVTYELRYTNTGDAAGVVSPVDDYDEAHFLPTSISDGGDDNGDTISWSNIQVPAATEDGPGTKSVFYTGTVIGTFSGDPGEGCGEGQYPVINTVTITGETDTNTLCVDVGAELTITKTACPTSVVPGGILTYTISVKNVSSNAATNLVITDTVPAGTTLVDAGGGSVSNGTITWNVASLAAGQTVSKVVKVLVEAANGAKLTNTATADADNAPLVSTGNVVTDVSNAGAATHGMAYGADAEVLILNLINELGRVDTSAPPGPDVKANTVLPLAVPGIVSLGVINTASASDVDNDSAETTASASTADVNLLGGLIRASVVKAVSNSVATPFGSSANNLGSTIVGLTINNVPIANVVPGATLKVKDLLGLQTVAEVKVMEEVKSATLTNGKFTATHATNALRVTILKPLLGLAKGAEIIVSRATSDATYPSGYPCGSAVGTVSGKAFTAYVDGTLGGTDFLDVEVANAEITPFGGSAFSGEVANIPGVVVNGTTTNTSFGTLSPHPYATSRSLTEGVSILGGLITATALDVSATSTTTANSASTTFQRTFTNLRIAGTQIANIDISPNTVITADLSPLLKAIIILDERQLAGNGTKDTAGTINAIHVYVVGLDGAVTAEVIVASAHSDAHHT